MSKITGVVETALYVDDLPRSVRFYSDVLGLGTLAGDHRFHAFEAGPGSVLLLFGRGASLEPAPVPGGVIPPHDGTGPIHIGLAIEPGTITYWKARLAQFGVDIESRVYWERGGTSLYFRDPDGHAVELLTPGVWKNY